ncbi:MAG TPA: polysaccharide biosynthesis/export family protein [Gemmatimonadota bacterium]|jgi:polysaccharide export outer membrane protein
MLRPFAFALILTGTCAALVAAQGVGSADTTRSAAPAPVAMPSPTGSLIMFPGDSVRVTIWKEPDLSGAFQVDENSMLTLPLLGPRSVANLSGEQLRQQLLHDYATQLKNPSIDVAVVRRVSVVGAVAKPGLYVVDPTMKLSDIVAMAGGADDQGNANSIDIYRGATQLYDNLQMSAPVVPQLRSGDRLVVDQKSWVSRNGMLVLGSVLSTTLIITRILD